MYTDGIVGNIDDVVTPASNIPWENFLVAATEAFAYQIFKEKKPDLKRLIKTFATITDMSERNEKIAQVYNEGYSQHAIATCLGISQPQVNRIIRKMRGIGIT